MSHQDKYINHLIKFFETVCFTDKNMADQFHREEAYSSTRLYLKAESTDPFKKNKSIKSLAKILADNDVEYTITNPFDIMIDITSLFNVSWHSLDIYKSAQVITKYNL